MKLCFAILGLGLGLGLALMAHEVARLYRTPICPKCGGREFSEFSHGLLTCKPCGNIRLP